MEQFENTYTPEDFILIRAKLYNYLSQAILLNDKILQNAIEKLLGNYEN